jgi:hypothetical protein
LHACKVSDYIEREHQQWSIVATRTTSICEFMDNPSNIPERANRHFPKQLCRKRKQIAIYNWYLNWYSQFRLAKRQYFIFEYINILIFYGRKIKSGICQPCYVKVLFLVVKYPGTPFFHSVKVKQSFCSCSHMALKAVLL